MLSALKQIKNLIAVLMLLAICLSYDLDLAAEASESHNDAQNKHKTVRLAYLISPGYQEGVGPNEIKQGFGYDYYQKLAYFTGWKYEYVYGNFGELLNKLRKGEIDMMGNLSYTPERAKDILFGSEEMGRESFYFYTKVHNMDNFVNGITDFNGKIIGVNEASYQKELLKKWIAEHKLTGVRIFDHKNKQERYDALNNGRSDVAVSTMLSQRDHQNADWVTVKKLGDAPFYIGISKKRPDLLKELNAAQHKILTIEPEFNYENYNKYMNGVIANSTYLFPDEKQWLKNHPVLKVGYLSDFSPYCWVDDKGKMQGVLALVLDNFEKNFNVKTERIPFINAKELLAGTMAGKVDIMAPALGSAAKAEQDGISLSTNLMQGPMVLVFNGNYRKGLTKRIAVTNCNAAGAVYAYNYLKDSELVGFMSIPEACQGLVDGKADAIITQSMQYELMRKRFPEIRDFNTVPLPNDLYIRFGTGFSPELISLLNKNISMVDKDEIDRFIAIANDIPKKYTWKEQLMQNVGGVAFTLLAFLGVIFVGVVWYMQVAEEKNRVLTEAKENAERMLLQEQTLRKELEEARRVADHDGLTGLLNKGSFENLLEVYKSSRNIAMMIIDFDDFKSINDNYGHDIGDEALRFVAASLQECFRTSDFVCRIGGDEFAVIMTNITSEQRDIIVQKINRIREMLSKAPDTLPQVSVSIGCAFSDRSNLKDAREIFRHADKALYSVKENGKNSYAFYN